MMSIKPDYREVILRSLKPRGKKGVVLFIALSFTALISAGTVSLIYMVSNDTMMVRRVQHKGKALLAAEAGISHALADIVQNGFSAGMSDDINGVLDEASYLVTFSETGGRFLITSTGYCRGVERVATLEVRENTPDALNYFAGAGNNVTINSLLAAAIVNGDIHANNRVVLHSGPLFASIRITGDVSASDIVREGSRHDDPGTTDWRVWLWDLLDDRVFINEDNNDSAVVFEGQPNIVFPTFDFDRYRQTAIDDGSYYPADHVFISEILSPGQGIVYVEGAAIFEGVNTLNGGIIAENIEVRGKLFQNETEHNRNVIIAKSGNIDIVWKFYTERALVYAAQDIRSIAFLGFFDDVDIEINGLMLAGRNITFWDVATIINYNYVPVFPVDMMDENGEAMFQIVSLNK